MPTGTEAQVEAMVHRLEDLYYTLRALDQDGLLKQVLQQQPNIIQGIIALLEKP